MTKYKNNLLKKLFELKIPYKFLMRKNMNEILNILFPLDIDERFIIINNLLDNSCVNYLTDDNKIIDKKDILTIDENNVSLALTQKGGAIAEKLLNVDWTTYHDCEWGCDMSLNTANMTKLNHIKEIASTRLSSESCLQIIEKNPWNATYWKTLDMTGYQIKLTLTNKEFRRYFNFYSYWENKYKLPPSDLNIPIFLDEKEKDSLSKKLNLKSRNTNMDWDLEFSDYERIEEFIYFFNEEKLSDDEKFLLIALIFASFDDAILKTSQMNIILFSKFMKILKSNYTLVKPILDYWMLDKGNGSFGEYLIQNKPTKKKK